MTKRQSLWSLISFSRHPHQWNLQMKKEYYVYKSLKCRVSPERMKITKAHEESERTQRVSLCQCILLCCCLLLSIPSQFLTLKQIHDLMNIPLSSWKVIIPCFVRPFRFKLFLLTCEADVSMTQSFSFLRATDTFRCVVCFEDVGGNERTKRI